MNPKLQTVERTIRPREQIHDFEQEHFNNKLSQVQEHIGEPLRQLFMSWIVEWLNEQITNASVGSIHHSTESLLLRLVKRSQRSLKTTYEEGSCDVGVPSTTTQLLHSTQKLLRSWPCTLQST